MAGSVAFSFVLFSLGSNGFDRQKKVCTIISFLNSYCNFLDLLFTWAVKKTELVFSASVFFSFALVYLCVCVLCVCGVHVCVCRTNLQAYGLWNILIYYRSEFND